jgi:membrane associated rhomboid family serine protease
MTNISPPSAPQEPVFNISEKWPLYLAGILIAVHVLVFHGQIAGLGAAERAAETWGVLKSADFPGQSGATKLVSLLGHGFLHGSWTHVLLNAAMLVPFGVVTIRGAKLLKVSKGRPARGNGAFLIIFFASVIIGGLGQLLYWSLSGETGLALGASGGVSGLFASAAWAMGGKPQLLKFGFGWLMINALIVGLGLFAGNLLSGGAGIAWAAHLAGFAGGAIFAPFLVRANSTNFKVTH